MSAQMLNTNGGSCPLMSKLYQECYCNSMNSQDIEKIIFFCGGSYRSCDLYRQKFLPEKVKSSGENVVGMMKEVLEAEK